MGAAVGVARSRSGAVSARGTKATMGDWMLWPGQVQGLAHAIAAGSFKLI